MPVKCSDKNLKNQEAALDFLCICHYNYLRPVGMACRKYSAEKVTAMATQELTAREQRGLALSAVGKLTRRGKLLLVPSATGTGKKYTVLPDEDCPFCSCPDFEERGEPCKHVFASRYTSKREAGGRTGR